MESCGDLNSTRSSGIIQPCACVGYVQCGHVVAGGYECDTEDSPTSTTFLKKKNGAPTATRGSAGKTMRRLKLVEPKAYLRLSAFLLNFSGAVANDCSPRSPLTRQAKKIGWAGSNIFAAAPAHLFSFARPATICAPALPVAFPPALPFTPLVLGLGPRLLAGAGSP